MQHRKNKQINFLKGGIAVTLTPPLKLINLNANQHGIVFNVLRITDVLDRSKLHEAIAHVVLHICWPLKGTQVGVGNKGRADVLTKFGSLGLVQDCKGDPSGKWPLKNAIIIALHHVNKQSNVSSNSTVHSIQVNTHVQPVTIEAGIEGWAVYGRRNAVDGVLATLSVVLNPPDETAITHTAFELKPSRFLTVEPNKRKNISSFSHMVKFFQLTAVNSCCYHRNYPPNSSCSKGGYHNPMDKSLDTG